MRLRVLTPNIGFLGAYNLANGNDIMLSSMEMPALSISGASR